MSEQDTSRSDETGAPIDGGRSVAPEPGKGTSHTIIGAVLLLVAVIGISFFFGRPAPSDEAEGFATWNTVIVIGSAVFGGVGVYLLMRGIAHRRRRAVYSGQ